jgi:hypothetical protein
MYSQCHGPWPDLGERVRQLLVEQLAEFALDCDIFAAMARLAKRKQKARYPGESFKCERNN